MIVLLMINFTVHEKSNALKRIKYEYFLTKTENLIEIPKLPEKIHMLSLIIDGIEKESIVVKFPKYGYEVSYDGDMTLINNLFHADNLIISLTGDLSNRIITCKIRPRFCGCEFIPDLLALLTLIITFFLYTIIEIIIYFKKIRTVAKQGDAPDPATNATPVPPTSFPPAR